MAELHSNILEARPPGTIFFVVMCLKVVSTSHKFSWVSVNLFRSFRILTNSFLVTEIRIEPGYSLHWAILNHFTMYRIHVAKLTSHYIIVFVFWLVSTICWIWRNAYMRKHGVVKMWVTNCEFMDKGEQETRGYTKKMKFCFHSSWQHLFWILCCS